MASREQRLDVVLGALAATHPASSAATSLRAVARMLVSAKPAHHGLAGAIDAGGGNRCERRSPRRFPRHLWQKTRGTRRKLFCPGAVRAPLIASQRARALYKPLRRELQTPRGSV